LLLHANNHGRIVKGNIHDGMVVLEDKQFMVDTSNPILLEKGLGVKPLYILKWSSTVPATNLHRVGDVQYVEDTKLNAERRRPQFEDKYNMTPNMLKKVMGMKILGNMIKTKADKKWGSWVWILLGGVAIMLIVYGLVFMGYIKF
jgi:hypothetical protein